jgi:hypothetical protein
MMLVFAVVGFLAMRRQSRNSIERILHSFEAGLCFFRWHLPLAGSRDARSIFGKANMARARPGRPSPSASRKLVAPE